MNVLDEDLTQSPDIADVDVDELERRLEMSVGHGAVAPDYGITIGISWKALT